jgi:phage shock protein A
MGETEESDLLTKAKKPAELLPTKTKVSAAKGMVTRSIKKLESSCGEFSSLRTDIPELTKHRLATEIQENRKKVEKNLTQLEETGEVLMSLIAELDQKDASEDPEIMINKVIEDIESYMEKYKMVKIDNVETLEAVDSLLKPTENSKKTVTSNDGSASTEYGRFTAVSDLKPVFLDKEASMVEVNQ